MPMRWPARWPRCERGRAVSGQALSRQSLAAFVLVAVIWGSTWLVIKDQISATPPSWTIAFRFILAAAGATLLAVVRGESLRLPRPAIAVALAVGIAQFVGNFHFVYRAEHYLTSGIVAVFYATLMVPNALLARVFLKAQVGRRFLAGSGVALAGVALLLINEYRLAPPGGEVPLGVALMVGGLLTASVANVVQASAAARSAPVVPVLAWALGFGALIDVAVALVVDGWPVLETRPAYWAGVAYLGVVGSVLTFPLYFGLIRTLGPGKAAYNGVLVPVIAMALSTLFEGYVWSALAVAGSVVAMAGLLIALSGRK